LNKLIRRLSRGSADNDVWPVLLVFVAVVIPAVFLLWFMTQAMRNERLAAQQKLTDAYRGLLSSAQSRLEENWTAKLAELDRLAQLTPASAAFARCVRSGIVDSVVIVNESGRITYPNVPSGPENRVSEQDPQWARASQFEYGRNDFVAAAQLYDQLARGKTNANLAARAWQAEIRCLAEAGEKEAAVQLIDRAFADHRFGQALDMQGRLIAANADLLSLELSPDPGSPAFQARAKRLAARLMDYDNPALASSQRRFLMRELKSLSPEFDIPMLAAEELAAQFAESHPAPGNKPVLGRSPFPDLWECASPNHRCLALIGTEKLLTSLVRMAIPRDLPPDAELSILPPGSESRSAFCLTPAGPRWPGWQLALSFRDQTLVAAAAEHRTALYLWTAVLVVAVVSILTLLAIRVLRQQTALARLKNGLAATVSHELKTPLASTRVLVDTLLDCEKMDENRVREYLKLVARENDRLGRLIHNFLAFSRMERKEHAFTFASVSAREIIDATAAVMHERFEAPGCQFDVQVGPNLPKVMADSDAMVTALINLLDNAWKYSEETKQITLGARADNGQVLFWVQDNGIGIAPHETGKIFRAFYQADRRLSSATGGCGLGLSIVEFIASAHHGRVSVESQPGRGSTFTLRIPVEPIHPNARKQIRRCTVPPC
jgi:signal transduction histidine kinase